MEPRDDLFGFVDDGLDEGLDEPGRGSGDGHKLCADGVGRWGLYGAAGLLFVSPGLEPKLFLVQRSPYVYHGSTWGIPGGARDRDEEALDAAWRETLEELGLVDAPPHRVRGAHVDQPAADWSYTTVVVEVEPESLAHDPDHFATDEGWETDDAGWFTRAQLDDLDLHPAFAATLESGVLDHLLGPSLPALEQTAEQTPALEASVGEPRPEL